MNLILEIATPEKIVYQNEVDEVIVPTINGQITILPNHINLLTKIEPGELTIKKGKATEFLAITGGFLEVVKNKITILADYAVHSEEIEAAKALEAQKRAQELMKQAKERASQKDFALAEAELRKAILELKVVNKRRALRTTPSTQ